MLALALLFGALCLAEGKHNNAINPVDFTCSDVLVIFEGHPEDFPRYKGTELSLGLCPLDENFSVKAPFGDCGFNRWIEGDLVTFSGNLRSIEPPGMITRRKPVNVKLYCEYNRATQMVGQVGVAPFLDTHQQQLNIQGADVQMHLRLTQEGIAMDAGEVLAVPVGSIVHFEVGGLYLDQMHLNARATDCWTTPTPNPMDTIRYDLSKDSCALDDTFVMRPFGHGQKISFESFAFSHKVKSHLYLHCNLVACDESEPTCGVCWPKKRKKRSLKHHYNIRAMVRVTKDIQMK